MNTDLIAELAACPFCGSEARHGTYDIPAVQCCNEACGASLHRYHREEAYVLWNTRTHHAELKAALRDAETLQRVKSMRDVWMNDDREYLITYGQHHPVSLSCMVDKIDAAMNNSAGDEVTP